MSGKRIAVEVLIDLRHRLDQLPTRSGERRDILRQAAELGARAAAGLEIAVLLPGGEPARGLDRDRLARRRGGGRRCRL